MSKAVNLDALTEDIFEAVRAGRLLRPTEPLPRQGAHVITSFDEALDYASRRYVIDAADAANWRDLRALETAALVGASYSSPEMAPIRAEIRDLGQRFANLLNLPEPYEAAFNDVVADLQNISHGRVVPAAGTGLYTRMWDIYRLGGWPCGWEGNYPDGSLVVFVPALVS